MKIDEIKYCDELTGAPLIIEFRKTSMDPTIKNATDLLQLDGVRVSFRPGYRKKSDDSPHAPKLIGVRIVVTDQIKEAIKSGDARLLESLLVAAIEEQRVCVN